MSQIRFYIFCIIFLSSFATNAATYRTAWQVSGDKGKSCTAYLHGSAPMGRPLVLMLAGTGIYTTGDMVQNNPLVETLISEKKATLLTLDKPGISYSQASKSHFVIRDEIYNQYTQRDMIFCTLNALREASLHGVSPRSNIYILGFSEGTQITARVYAFLLRSDATFAARIKAMFWGGLVMDPWAQIISMQIQSPEERAKFKKAYATKDDATLRTFGDLAYAYWADIFSTESNIETLHKMTLHSPDALIHIYHGLQDQNTSPKPVIEFDRWNSDRYRNALPALKARFHYYQAGHELNREAVTDIANELSKAIAD